MTEYNVSGGKLHNGNPDKPYTFRGIKTAQVITGDNNNTEQTQVTYYPNPTGIICRIVNNSWYEALQDGDKVIF